MKSFPTRQVTRVVVSLALAACALAMLAVTIEAQSGSTSRLPGLAAPKVFSVNSSGGQVPPSFQSVATGDFNGDGIPDFAAVGLACLSGLGESVGVFLGNGDGTFQPIKAFRLADCPMSIAAARLRGSDAPIDLVIADLYSIEVLRGKGDGTFEAPQVIATFTNYSLTQVTVGDFNGDGKIDIATSLFGGAVPSSASLYDAIGVMLNNGDGTFQAPLLSQSPADNNYSIAVGDFNNDGKLDVLTRPGLGAHGLYLSLGNGDGTFLPAYLVWTEPISVFVTLANGINSFAVGDFNDDGKLDVALNINGARVDVLLGTGTGAFVSTGTIEIDQHQSGGDGLGQIAASKLSKNGHVDLVVDTGYGATLVILRGNGDGTFQSPTIYPLPQTEDEGVIVTDLNNDGAPDIAIGTAGGFSTTNYMTVLLNNGDGDFGPIPPLFPVTTIPGNEPATNAVGVTLSDLTNSGKLDLIVTTWNTPIEPAINGQLPPVPSINPQTTSVNTRGAIAVLAGNGDGTFQTEQQFYVDGRRPTGVAAADLDGDGKNDVVTANAVDNNISILKGNGDHTFQTSIPIAVGTNPTAVAVADVNGDKKPDIIVTNLADNTVAVLLNQSTPGNLAFAAPVNYAVATYPDSVVAGDFNHDGKVDLVVLGAGNFFASDDSGKHTRLSVLLGNGDGTFAPAVTQTLDNQDGGESLVAADLGRGEIDLAVAHFNKNEVLILQDDGHGNFTKTASYQTGAGPEGLVAVDLDGDGKSDIAVGNLNDHTVTVLTGNGDGTFVSTGNRAGVLEPFGNATWHYPAFVAAGDLDGDAKPDLVTTHLFEAAAAVLRNTSPDVPKSTPTPTPSATANPSATVTPTATATPTVTPSPATTATPTPSPTTTPSPAQLLNISGRVVAQTGDNVAIAGFIISGSHAKHVLVRGMGPSMRANGQRVSGALEDPTIELHDASDALVASNVDWRSDQQNDIQATGLAPSDDREAAIVRDLPAGRYTAIVKGANSTAGVALAEVFDLQPNQGGELGNLSVRANVGTDDDVLIDGLIIGGSEPKQVLFRALGPELAARNVFNPLQDPTLELHDANGALLIANDNWGDAPNRDAIKATGMAPRHDSESAILTTLSPGQYTSILRGANRTTGVALAEVYKLN